MKKFYFLMLGSTLLSLRSFILDDVQMAMIYMIALYGNMILIKLNEDK